MTSGGVFCIFGFDPIDQLCVLRITPHTAVHHHVCVSGALSVSAFLYTFVRVVFLFSFLPVSVGSEDQGGASLTA